MKARILVVSSAVIVLAANLTLHSFAPCSTFNSWSEPSTFYNTVWRLVIPATLILAFFSYRYRENMTARIMAGLLWLILFGVTIYGWYDGFWVTYEALRGSEAPWPKYC